MKHNKNLGTLRLHPAQARNRRRSFIWRIHPGNGFQSTPSHEGRRAHIVEIARREILLLPPDANRGALRGGLRSNKHKNRGISCMRDPFSKKPSQLLLWLSSNCNPATGLPASVSTDTFRLPVKNSENSFQSCKSVLNKKCPFSRQRT